MWRLQALALALLVGSAGGARAQAMGQEHWAARLRELLPAALCQPGTYFRECFEQSDAACRGDADAAVAACLAQHDRQMPPAFRAPEEAGRWGQVIAACAGNRFAAANRGAKRSAGRCADPKAWR